MRSQSRCLTIQVFTKLNQRRSKAKQKNQENESNATRKNVLEITSIQHISIISSESVTMTYSLVNLLQRCISSESATMIVFHTNNTMSKKRVYRSRRKTDNKSRIRIRRTRPKRRILAKDIERFIILIDLISRQNLIRIEKFEFAFYASMYARHCNFCHLSIISFDWHTFWICYDQIVWTRSQWNRHVEWNIWNVHEMLTMIQRDKN